MPEPTIGTSMQPLVADAASPWTHMRCRAHFFRYRRDSEDGQWEAEGQLTISSEPYDDGNTGPFASGRNYFRHVVRVHGALNEQMSPLPPLTLSPRPVSPMHIDVRYVASSLFGPTLGSTGSSIEGLPQSIDLSVDGTNVSAHLGNDDTTIDSIEYLTNNKNEIVVIGALWFDNGYDWFWLNFRNVNPILRPISDLDEFIKVQWNQRQDGGDSSRQLVG